MSNTLLNVMALITLTGILPASKLWGQTGWDPNLLPVLDVELGEMITIFAEKNNQRRYAERFAEKVYEAAYETTGEPAGKGLVIISNIENPHPLILVRRYIEILETNNASIDKKEFGPALEEFLKGWEEGEKEVQKEIGVEIEDVAYVAPMPLDPLVFNLYMTARQVAFDDSKIEEQFASLSPSELKDAEFEKFDWIIYLPPKNAIDKVIKTVLPSAMKAQKIGPVKRVLARGVVFTFKPLIRDAMEAVRKGMLYESILRATSDLDSREIELLADAYQGALMPQGSVIPGKKMDRSLEAIRRQKQKNEEYAKDPFIAPTERIKLDPGVYSKYEGEYNRGKARPVKIFSQEGVLHFQRGQNKPLSLEASSMTLFVGDEEKLTVEFLDENSGVFTQVELRRERWRRSFNRKTADS